MEFLLVHLLYILFPELYFNDLTKEEAISNALLLNIHYLLPVHYSALPTSTLHYVSHI
jgi:hypothetical protein